MSVSNTESWLLATSIAGLVASPAVATLYSKSSGAALQLSYSIAAVLTVMWGLVGFSEVYSNPLPTGVVGMTDYATINNIGQAGQGTSGYTAVTFELAFALLTINLIAGAVGHVFKPQYFVTYALAFLVLNYTPQAMWFWNRQGFANVYGIVDLAGGAVVHVTAGVAALVLGLLAKGYNETSFYGENLVSLLVLIVSSVALNSGKAASVGTAGLAAVNTLLASSGGLAGYNFLEMVISKRLGLFPLKYTLQGSIKGAAIGLAVVASGAAVVGPFWTVMNAFAAVFVIYFVEALLVSVHLGVGKNVFLVHGLGGAAGMALTGIFADSTFSSIYSTNPVTLGVNGAFYRNAILLGKNAAGASIIVLMTAVSSVVLFYFLSLTAYYVFATKITADEEEKAAPAS